MADVYQALSSPVRREIIAMLKKRDMTAGEIDEKLDVSKSTLSGHFNVLKGADLIVADKVGTTITYSLNASVVEEIMASLLGLLSKTDDQEEQKGDKS